MILNAYVAIGACRVLLLFGAEVVVVWSLGSARGAWVYSLWHVQFYHTIFRPPPLRHARIGDRFEGGSQAWEVRSVGSNAFACHFSPIFFQYHGLGPSWSVLAYMYAECGVRWLSTYRAKKDPSIPCLWSFVRISKRYSSWYLEQFEIGTDIDARRTEPDSNINSSALDGDHAYLTTNRIESCFPGSEMYFFVSESSDRNWVCEVCSAGLPLPRSYKKPSLGVCSPCLSHHSNLINFYLSLLAL